MSSNFIEIKNLKLAFEIINNHCNKTIFFIHGNSGSCATWKKQVGDPLFSQYRQVAIDLPGHGCSSKSSNPEVDYTPIGTANTLAEAISVLSNNTPYILIGFSYATNLIGEMLNLNIKPSGIVLLGLCCLGENFGMDKVFKQSNIPSVFFYNEKDRTAVEHFIGSIVRSIEDAKFLTDDYFKTDEQFKPKLMKAATNGKITDEIKALKIAAVPLCIINGAEDKLCYPDYIKNSDLCFWNDDIAILEDTGHFVQLDNPAEVNNIIAGYAKDVFRPTHVLKHSS